MNGDELRTLRSELGLSQDRLAQLLDVSRRQIIRWEQGSWPVPRIVELALATVRREMQP